VVKQKNTMRRFYQRQKKHKRKNVILTLVSDNVLRVKLWKVDDKSYKALCDTIGYHGRKKTFDVSVNDYKTILQWSNTLGLDVDDIPDALWRMRARKNVGLFHKEAVPEKLWTTLFDYQKVGVRAAFETFNGRVLLADDMGLGKTRQALCFIAHCLPQRTLIICPSYLRYHWKAGLLSWLDVDEVQLVAKGSETLDENICVVSYDMLARLNIPTGIFDVVVCDESHYVKSRKTKRTKACTPLVKSARFAMLITGTPALNRPIELYSQLHMLRPMYVRTYTQYAQRYCNGKPTPYGYDDRGSSNSHELHWVLKRAFMIRRLKRDVLTQLPPKTRHTVWLDVTADNLKDIDSGFAKWKKLNSTIYKLPSGSEQQREQLFERKKIISELFRATAVAKCDAVARWVMDTLASGQSFIFFAYHRNILDAVEAAVQGQYEYMRIDGSTPAAKRQSNVEDFQSSPNMRIAILSIMAAGTGVTLTRVSRVVFGELFWVPGVMIQAEDRAHRISQTQPVEITHLMGTETLDTYVHPSLCKKLATLDSLVDRRNDRTFAGKTVTHVADEDEESVLSLLSKHV